MAWARMSASADAGVVPIYKYISEPHLEAFVTRGEVLFRSLSYFQHHEDLARGDPGEGTRTFRPPQGLTITKVHTGETLQLDMAFESTAQTGDIFVFCASTRLDAMLAEAFQAFTCVEIQNTEAFAVRVRNALSSRRSGKFAKTLRHDLVRYYNPGEPPNPDWALPEKIAFLKLASYSWQSEYRFAFAMNEAFRVYGTNLRLTNRVGRPQSDLRTFPNPVVLRLGDLRNICKVHRFESLHAA